MKLKQFVGLMLLAACAAMGTTQAADYSLDKGEHASVTFKFKHLGYSWLTGRFNKLDGQFSYDPANIEDSSIEVTVDVASLDTNHAERDKHIRSDEYLDVDKYPTAKFVSTRFEDKGDGKLTVYGDLTLHGVTKEIAIDAARVGEGDDPWGGYRAGFEGTFVLNTKDFGMEGFRPTHQVEMELNLEGIKKK